MLSKLRNMYSRGRGLNDADAGPIISCVLILHDMAAQAENTIRSLMSDYQQGVQQCEYEVIVVENESASNLSQQFIASLPENFHYHLLSNPERSPGPAINFGASKARGDNICVLIDGARILTPGVIKNMILAHRLGDKTVVSMPGYHLGEELQQEAVKSGYSTTTEKQLLSSINWPQNGYRLFEISCLNGSSGLGFFLPNSESNCISIPRYLWDALGGYDVRFDLGGGGLINLDFYKRACESSSAQHIILVGEGTFHQLHGGVTTGGKSEADRAL
ncbi:glycosyltransferase, partial [bacterium]|nr:glycosyltransferase [bacterium]